jgi:uncharacterized radical SAM superfamily protein
VFKNSISKYFHVSVKYFLCAINVSAGGSLVIQLLIDGSEGKQSLSKGMAFLSKTGLKSEILRKY